VETQQSSQSERTKPFEGPRSLAIKNTVRISEAASHLGVGPQHLRALERAGRIPPARRDRFGNRIYGPVDLALLRAVGVGTRPRRLRVAEEVLAGMT
jgi:hypothetical protein